MRIILFTLSLLAFTLYCSARISPSLQKQHPVFLNETYSSGFLPNHNGAELFYIAFNSRSDPDTDPLIIWLTGGPGCSGELSLFFENGPVKINNETLDLYINPYSWNNKANLLYVDQPAGTGFSTVKHYDNTEKEIARDFYNFFKEFLKAHPQFKGRSLYIAGESFSGHYIPVIAKYFLDQENPDVSLKGIAIGNGWVDPGSQYPEYPIFAIENNLIEKEEDELIIDMFMRCTETLNSGDLISVIDVCGSGYAFIVKSPPAFNIYDIRLPCLGPMCYNLTFIEKFLEKPDVKEALGVTGKKWVECSSGVQNHLKLNHEIDYASYVAALLEKGLPVLIYSGDKDYVCNYKGGEAWTEALDYPGHRAFKRAPVTSFGSHGLYKSAEGLTFFRVLEAGHLVPMDQPETAISMLYAFIDGKFDN